MDMEMRLMTADMQLYTATLSDQPAQHSRCEQRN